MAVTTYSLNEVFYEADVNDLVGNSAVHFIYPQLGLYNNSGETLDTYSPNSDDRIVSADVAFLELKTFIDSTQENPTAYDDGDFSGTNVHGSFYALSPRNYYYNESVAATNLTGVLARGTAKPRIAEAIKLPVGSSGGTFETKSLGMQTPNVNRFDDIEVEGLNEGIKPESMAATAIRLEGTKIDDVTYGCFSGSTVYTNTVTQAVIAQSGRTGWSGIVEGGFDKATNNFAYDTITGYSAAEPADGWYVSAVEIVNVERELDDFRYGEMEDDLPYIFTGASYYFTGTQVADNTAVDIPVWGGDCFIGLHTFKVADTSYSLTDQTKLETGLGTAPSGGTEQTDRWKHWFNKNSNVTTAGVSDEDMSRPYPLKGVSQTITVLLESEINPEFAEKPPHNGYSYDETAAMSKVTGNLPVPVVNDAGQIRSKFNYYYNLDYFGENKYKVFTPYQEFNINNTEFGARVAYSDQKVYNTDIEGFDRFRVLNFYDMDESNGSITKLVELGDRIFSIQESALSYLPVTAQTIQTADGSGLSVRSGEIIGTPNKINTLYGTQHPATVKLDGTTMFFVDQVRGEVCSFDGQQIQLISRSGLESYFTDKLSGIGKNDLAAVYDSKKKEYFLFFKNAGDGVPEGMVFNAANGMWVSRLLEDANTTTLGGTRIANTMLMLGIKSDDKVWAGELYGDNAVVSQWWGASTDPKATIVINQEPESVKTFDGLTFVSDRVIEPLDFTVVESDGTSSVADLSTAVVNDKEGTFRLKNLRDASGARSRGVYGSLTFYLNDTALTGTSIKENGTTCVLTKYRTSKRPI